MRARIQSPVVQLIILFALMLLLRVPFYFTHHVQEDAYISLRCAEILVESGVYGFNPGERVSSSTSHLYVFIAALVRLAVGHSAFLPVMLVLNTMFFLAGAFFISRVLLEEEKQQLLLWVFISILPVGLLISYSGMETSLLVFMVGAALYLVHRTNNRSLLWLVLALLPWVRPDAVAYALLIVFWVSVRERRLDWRGTIAALSGLAGMLIFNRIYFGAWLHQSINAKLLMRHAFSIKGMLQNLGTVFIGQADGGIFAPIRTRYLSGFGILFLLVILTGIVYYLWHRRGDRKMLIIGLAVASMAILIPLAYAFGGVLYQWYFWPSSLLGYAILLAVILKITHSSKSFAKVTRGLLILALILGGLAQWAFSYSWGMKEYAYRGGIGVWLQQHAQSGDRVLLEPAGYIPYYSDLYTYDEVGLVSPQVVTYRQAYDLRWWPEFVMDYQPEWIIQRAQITQDTTYQGYRLTGEESEWFHRHYDLAASFSFIPEDFADLPLLVRLLRLGQVDDYYVFSRK